MLGAVDIVHDIVLGPRGRYFLMNLAVAFDNGFIEESGFRTLEHVLWRLGRDVGYNTRRRGISPSYTILARARKLAPLLEQVPLIELTPKLIYDALDSTVNNAAYWEPPSNIDLLLASHPLKRGLLRIAHHVHASPFWIPWSKQFFAVGQSSVSWKAISASREDTSLVQSVLSAQDALKMWQAEAMHPDVWWSRPPRTLIRTSGELEDGIPGSLRFVEDGLGWNIGQVQHATISPGARVFTINGPDDWVFLCRRFPREIPMADRPNWKIATGYPHDWVIPDYAQVAQYYDGVHLSFQGYLATAG